MERADLGQAVLGIRVIQWKGTAMTFSHAAVRNIVPLRGRPAAAYTRSASPWPPATARTAVSATSPPTRSSSTSNSGPSRSGRWSSGRGEADQRTAAAVAAAAGVAGPRTETNARWTCACTATSCAWPSGRDCSGRRRSYFESRLELAPDEYESDEKFVFQLAAVLSEQGPQ